MPQRLNTAQVKPSTINFVDPGGSNFTTTSATYVDVTGITTTYTTGPTQERLFVWFQGMVTNSAVASGQVTLSIGGVDQTELAIYKDDTAQWDSFCKFYMYDAPANTTVTLKARASNSGGSTITVHRSAPYLASIRGFATAR